jgi:phosphoribosyl-AMP cyclohydrolase
MHYYSRAKKSRWCLSQTGAGRQRLLEIRRDEDGETLVASIKLLSANDVQEACDLQWIVSSEGAIEVVAYKKSTVGA